MKTYWAVLPEKARASRRTSSASKAMKFTTASKPRDARASSTLASLASPLTCKAPASGSAARWPRVRIVSRWPCASASRTQAVDRFPVPPKNSRRIASGIADAVERERDALSGLDHLEVARLQRLQVARPEQAGPLGAR